MKSPARYAIMLTAALSLLLIGAQPGDSLTVYRIGDTAGVTCGGDVRCLDWFEVTDVNNFGLAQGVASPNGFLQPEALDINDNIAPIVRDREHGWLKSNNSYGWQDEGRADGTGLDFIIDGDVTTAYTGVGNASGNPSCGNALVSAPSDVVGGPCKAIWFKLGGLFPIDRVAFRTTPENKNERFVDRFTIGANDATVERVLTDMGKNSNLREREAYINWRSGVFVDFDVVHHFRENTQDILDLEMPSKPISEIIFVAPVGTWEIAEFEIYGAGFTAEASYVTELISLDDFSSLGDLTWSGDVPVGSKVELSMRTGDDTTPEIFWRWDHTRGGVRTRLNDDADALDRFDYFGGGPDRKEKLSDGEKAGITPDKDNWEFWAPPVEFDKFRVDLVGNKPRKYVQLRADFSSEVAEAGGRLDFLQFEVSSPPLATRVLAEIVPLQAPLGETTKFTYKVNPSFTAGTDLGFDSIQIFTPLAPESVDSLRFENTQLGPGEFTLIEHDVDGESFTVQLPKPMKFVDQEVIDVVFHAAVFKVGTVFNARVFNSDLPEEVRQRVTVGDADPLFDSSSLSVIPADVGSKVIASLRVSALTPNGDNANETLTVEYDLVNLDGNVPVTLSVFTLAGELVVDLPVTSVGSGRFPATWNGVGAGGDLVPPGLYVLRLEVESDKETATALATFPVVY